MHGALCYGYSGLCLFSSMVGGRSGNRGRCSQACRMRYRLEAGGEVRPLERVLSTSDLAAIDSLPALLAAGVTSFKIEGRMKDAGYVAVATAVYREALDEALADPVGYRTRPEWLSRLGQSFSRGFTNAHLGGQHASVRSAGRGGHRGVAVGRVEGVDEERGLVTLRTTEPLADGDVIVVYTPWGHTEPARVGSLRAAVARPARAAGESRERTPSHRTVVRLRERATVKDRVFRLSTGELDEFTRDAVAARSLARPVDLEMRIEGRAGERARLTATMPRSGHHPPPVTVDSAAPVEPARTVALDAARLRDALGALGGTPYRLTRLDSRLEGRVFLPVAALKELRRRAVAELDERRLAPGRRPAAPAAAPAPAAARPRPVARPATPRPSPRPGDTGDALPLVLRLRPGDEPVLSDGVAAVCLDLRGGDSATHVAAALDSLARRGVEVRCRPPEVLFDGELVWWSEFADLPWAAVYARHGAHLVAGLPAILEYPLQGLNHLLVPQLSAAGLVASPESSLEEITALVAASELPVEVFGFGRQQLLLSRDELGRREGLVPASGDPAVEEELSLVDAKGFVFPVTVGSRLRRSSRTPA